MDVCQSNEPTIGPEFRPSTAPFQELTLMYIHWSETPTTQKFEPVFKNHLSVNLVVSSYSQCWHKMKKEVGIIELRRSLKFKHVREVGHPTPTFFFSSKFTFNFYFKFIYLRIYKLKIVICMCIRNQLLSQEVRFKAKFTWNLIEIQFFLTSVFPSQFVSLKY